MAVFGNKVTAHQHNSTSAN